MIQTPIGDEAKFIVESDGETAAVSFDDGSGNYVEIAWSAPDLPNHDHFLWLVRSAASFHSIPVEENLDGSE